MISFLMGNKVLLSFSGLLGSNPPNIGAAQLVKKNGEEVTVSSIQVIGDSTLLIIPANDQQFNEVKASIESFNDRYGTPTIPYNESIYVSFNDTAKVELY